MNGKRYLGAAKRISICSASPARIWYTWRGLPSPWTRAHGKADGVSECFVILTTDANPYMMDYHARMPILLLPEDREAWLNGEKASRFLERAPLELEAELV